MSSRVFGPDFSRALCLGCASIGALPDWVIATLLLESNGMDPLAANRSGARGLWQKMPDPIVIDGVPRTVPPGAPAPPGCVLRPVYAADGRTITALTVWRLYGVTDPVRQVNDYFAHTRALLAELKAGKIATRSALYCLNLAPARLHGGAYTDATIVYSADPDDEPLNHRGGAYAKTYWPEAYKANALAFGLDPHDPRGRITMGRLAVGLDAAVERHRERYEAELAAAYVANANGGLGGAGA